MILLSVQVKRLGYRKALVGQLFGLAKEPT